MSALVPVPFSCVTQGHVTPAMRNWMDNVLGDAIDFDNRISVTPRTNIVIDGGMQIAQGAAQSLAATAKYGLVDMWAAWMSSGTPTAGTISRANAVSSTSYAVNAAAFTGTGNVTVSFRQRIGSNRARAFGGLVTNNVSASLIAFSGQAFNVVLILRKPTATDNYAATTTIYTSAAQAVTPNAWTTLKFQNIALGDVRNGLEIEVQFQYGAAVSVATDARLADVQLVLGSTVPAFLPRTFEEEMPLVQRYFQKSFPYETAPATGAGTSGMQIRECVLAGAVSGRSQITFQRTMRASPTMTFYNPTSANANWYSLSRAADSGAATVPYAGTRSIVVQQTQVAADAAGQLCGIHWTADARL